MRSADNVSLVGGIVKVDCGPIVIEQHSDFEYACLGCTVVVLYQVLGEEKRLLAFVYFSSDAIWCLMFRCSDYTDSSLPIQF